MNELSKARQLEIKELLAAGNTLRSIAAATGVAKQTVVRYAKLFVVRGKCGCGDKAGHNGWCWYRFQFSPQRQGYVAETWRARSRSHLSALVRAAANRAQRLGHQIGPFVWASPFGPGTLAWAKCRECGARASIGSARGYVQNARRATGRLIEIECITAETRIALRKAAKEKKAWQSAKRTLREVQRVLRSPSSSPNVVSTPARSSPR